MLPPLLSVLPTLLSPGHIVGDGVDAFGTGWFFWWIRACVTHLGNPSWTPLFFAPDGKDIFSHTGNNFVDAVFSVPFQVLFGGSWSAPFTLFLLAGNAWSFEQLAKELWPDTRDVVAATLAWMVNPYVIFELTAGRPTQACMWWLPLALVGLWRVCRGDGARAAVLLGVATALTGWTYWFAGYFLTFLMLPLCLWWGGFRRLPALALAAAVCTVLVLPMGVGMQASWAAEQVPGVASGGPRQANVSEDLHGIWLMETQGAPLLTQPAWALAALLGLWKGGSAGRKWAAIALLLVLIGLGARGGEPPAVFVPIVVSIPFDHGDPDSIHRARGARLAGDRAIGRCGCGLFGVVPRRRGLRRRFSAQPPRSVVPAVADRRRSRARHVPVPAQRNPVRRAALANAVSTTDVRRHGRVGARILARSVPRPTAHAVVSRPRERREQRTER